MRTAGFVVRQLPFCVNEISAQLRQLLELTVATHPTMLCSLPPLDMHQLPFAQRKLLQGETV